MWKPLWQIEFQQNAFNLVECHNKNYIDLKKVWLASQYYNENCDSK
jgi:hypothetical protein